MQLPPGLPDGDSGHILENIIYFELLRRGYDVAIGKLDNKEVDFIATKTEEKKFIQVTESMNAPETREQELSPCVRSRTTMKKSSSLWNATSPRVRTKSRSSGRWIFCWVNNTQKADRQKTCQLFLFLGIPRLFQFILHGKMFLVIHIPLSGKHICFLLAIVVCLQLIQMGGNMAILLAVTDSVHLPLQNLGIKIQRLIHIPCLISPNFPKSCQLFKEHLSQMSKKL